MKKTLSVLTFVFAAFALLFTTGCQSAGAGITPCTAPLTADDTYSVIGPAKGRAFAAILFVVPISESKPAGRARDRAIQSAGGDALIECTEDFSIIAFPFLTLVWTTCEGTAIKINHKGELVTK